MPIRRKTSMDSIRRYIDTKLKQKEASIIRNLGRLGEMCVNAARDTDTYKDQTGNLRSSTGFVLIKDGVIITQSGFESKAGKKGSGEKGSGVGESFAKELISSDGTGYVLIVVAGMNYAAYVEASGRDVLTSAEQLAIKEMPKILRKLKLA